jgi:hypothetical protein
MNPDLIILFVGEIFIILVLYRFVLRQWVVAEWEAKFDEDAWLVDRLEPVIDEIDLRLHEKLQNFQDSFFGSVGAMTKKAQELDPMNNIRKAASEGNWTSLLVEYAANKAGLGGLLASESQKTDQKQPKIAPIQHIPKPIKHMLKL